MARTMLAAVLALLVFNTAQSAPAIYRWQDEQGRVHYGDRPPAGITVQPVSTSPSTRSVVEPTAPDPRWQAVLADEKVVGAVRRRAEAQRLAFDRAERERKARTARCVRMTGQLDRLESRQRAGYSARSGVRLDERRRELKARWESECR